MATTKIWAVRARLDYLVRYVANTEKTANLTFDDLTNLLEYAGDEWKTEQKEFVTGIHCQLLRVKWMQKSPMKLV